MFADQFQRNVAMLDQRFGVRNGDTRALKSRRAAAALVGLCPAEQNLANGDGSKLPAGGQEHRPRRFDLTSILIPMHDPASRTKSKERKEPTDFRQPTDDLMSHPSMVRRLHRSTTPPL